MDEFLQPKWQDLAAVGPPPRRTHTSILDEGRKAVPDGRDSSMAFHGVSVFSELLPYHDAAKHNKIDLVHNFANMVKHSFATLMNTKVSGGKAKARFNAKRAEVCYRMFIVRCSTSMLYSYVYRMRAYV